LVHAQDDEALTRCTVILAAKARSLAWTCAGLHPARSETESIESKSTCEQSHAIVLAGGSAFGSIAAAV